MNNEDEMHTLSGARYAGRGRDTSVSGGEEDRDTTRSELQVRVAKRTKGVRSNVQHQPHTRSQKV